MAGETAESSRVIAAAPARVWEVIGDVEQMPAWSTELESVEILEGDCRSSGSRFRGNNRDATRAWSMTCVIDDYEPERVFAFHTEDAKGSTRTRWWYRLEPVDGGTRVTEGFLRVAKLNAIRALAERKLLGDRTAHNTRNIEDSLRKLAQFVEG